MSPAWRSATFLACPALQQAQVIADPGLTVLNPVEPYLHPVEPCFDSREAFLGSGDEIGQFLREFEQFAGQQADP